jgi:LysR family transcriptional regulator, glycine cleavage system transcriptional activator
MRYWNANAMRTKRYDVPPLDLIPGFEASARHLSFTLAADELSLTQSAVSRQIKTLEEHIGVALFKRQHRALALTQAGQDFYRVAVDILGRLQLATDTLQAKPATQQLSITTTTGFAALWLIPRLKRFTASHPEIDVRISATDIAVNIERDLVDVAIRYGSKGSMPDGALALFGEEILPVCSPALLVGGAPPLAIPADLKHHTLLHLDYPGMQRSWLEWGTWLTALGIGELKSSGSLYFSQYDQMIHAAIAGQGIALGRLPLLAEHIRTRTLVAPFADAVVGTRGYFILNSGRAATKPFVADFTAWLIGEAKGDNQTTI